MANTKKIRYVVVGERKAYDHDLNSDIIDPTNADQYMFNYTKKNIWIHFIPGWLIIWIIVNIIKGFRTFWVKLP